MTDYNERIEEMRNPIYICKCGWKGRFEDGDYDSDACEFTCPKCGFEFGGEDWKITKAKIELLNQLRAEAIEEVKEFKKWNTEYKEDIPKELRQFGTEGDYLSLNFDIIIDYLIKKWNITEEEL